jgi:hypothetical protein
MKKGEEPVSGGENPKSNQAAGSEDAHSNAPIGQYEGGDLGREGPTPPQQNRNGTERHPKVGTRTVEWLQFGVNAALALIAIGALYIYYGQLQTMKGELAQLVMQYPKLKESADAAESSAKTAALTMAENQRQFRETLTQMQAQSRAMQESAYSDVSSNRAWIVPNPPPQHKRNLAEATLEWHNAGKTPAVDVFSTTEYFIGKFPYRLGTCAEMERKLKKRPLSTWQYQGFIPAGGRYETGLSNTPAWVGQDPILIHGCVWYTDIVTNTERSTEFFLTAFQMRFAYPRSQGVSLFYLAGRPFIFK